MYHFEAINNMLDVLMLFWPTEWAEILTFPFCHRFSWIENLSPNFTASVSICYTISLLPPSPVQSNSHTKGLAFTFCFSVYLHLISVHPVTIMALPSQLCISKPSVDFLCARFLPSVCSCKYPASKSQTCVHVLQHSL